MSNMLIHFCDLQYTHQVYSDMQRNVASCISCISFSANQTRVIDIIQT